MSALVELVCLVYHEARNVRHVLRAGKLSDRERYAKLVNLPVNRWEAWRALEELRREAASAATAREVAEVFNRQFGLSLAELEELYLAPVWKACLYGGNKWAPICGAVRELIEVSVSGDIGRARELLEAVPRMAHNTGTVGEKLASLTGITAGAPD